MAVFMARITSKVKDPIRLSDIEEGRTIYILETVDGVTTNVPYVVACHNYESDYNTNRTLLVRKFSTGDVAWGTANADAWPDSLLYSTVAGYLSRFSEKVQAAIGTTNYPYTDAKGSTTVVRGEAAVFVPSVTELGLTYTYANVEGSALPGASGIVDYFNESGSNVDYWTRSSYNASGSYVANYITTSAAASRSTYSTARGEMVCFTLPGNARFDATTLSVREDLL